MTKLIIICGLPGVGKTTLANEISRELGIFCLHKDTIKESIYNSMKMSTLEDSKKLGYPSVKAILDLAEENIINGVDVILESPFSFPEDGKIFDNWKNKYKLDIFTIVLQLDEVERENRYRTRERHASHHDNERQLSQVDECTYVHMPETKIFLNTNKPLEILVQEALARIS
jgi:predicted kinase